MTDAIPPNIKDTYIREKKIKQGLMCLQEERHFVFFFSGQFLGSVFIPHTSLFSPEPFTSFLVEPNNRRSCSSHESPQNSRAADGGVFSEYES